MNKCIGLLYIFALLHTAFASANIIWPAMFIADALYASWFVVIVSILIEALGFYFLIGNITVIRALCMSFTGNAASFIVGTRVMELGVLVFPVFELLQMGTFHLLNKIFHWILMYLGSAAIELGALKICFPYTVRQLLVPILVGNFVTYFLTFIYQYFVLKAA